MVHILTDNGVYTGRTLKKANRKLKALIEDAELHPLGADKVVKLTNQDIDFVQDKKRLAQVPIANLYKSDSYIKYMLIGIMIIEFILLVKK